MAPVDRPRGLPLGHQVVQRRFIDHGEDDVAHRVVRPGQARRGQLEQERGLARDALQVGDQLALDPLLGLGGDAVHGGDQEVDERVGDLATAHVAEGGEQGDPCRRGMAPQLMQLLGGDASPIGEEHLTRRALERIGGQGHGPQGHELADLVGHALQAGPPGPGAQRDERGVAGVLGGGVKQGVEPGDRLGRQPGDQRRAEGGVVAP